MMLNRIRKFGSVVFPPCGGFSLIEILITLAMTGIIMSAVYAVYIANILAVAEDEQRVEVQQGQRFAMDFLMRELRHAGYDVEETDAPRIVEAGSDFIYYTADLNEDEDLADPGEHVVFCVYDNKLGYFTSDNAADIGNLDSDDDGFVDAGHTHGGASHQEISRIENIEYYYTLSNGTTKTTTPSKDGVNLEDIRTVDISILSRAENSDSKYENDKNYTTASNTVWGPYNDDFRRLMMISTVRFRNLGL